MLITENWTGMKQAVGGTTWTLEQARTANTVNEITDITNSVGSAWAEPTYDPAGNMQVIPQPGDPTQSLTGNWDAWNRLVKLVDDGTSDTVSEYEYDAQSRRIVKKLYDSGALDQTRHVYLSIQNQVLEERIDSASTPDQQNIWGLMYIDGLVLRDRDTNGDGTLDERLYCLQDANWNAVALADESGAVTQRFAYQPFGTCQFLDASYASVTNTSEWTTLFTGRELDLESGLYYFRARYVHPTLGVFLARDPIGYIDGLNLYAMYFAPNRLDPSGHGQSTTDCFNRFPPPQNAPSKEEISKAAAECASKFNPVRQRSKYAKCIAKKLGGDAGDALNEWMILVVCCKAQDHSPDPCSWGSKYIPGKGWTPRSPEEKCHFTDGKWEGDRFPGGRNCMDCCEFQACIDGFNSIGNWKEATEKILEGAFDYYTCISRCPSV